MRNLIDETAGLLMPEARLGLKQLDDAMPTYIGGMRGVKPKLYDVSTCVAARDCREMFLVVAGNEALLGSCPMNSKWGYAFARLRLEGGIPIEVLGVYSTDEPTRAPEFGFEVGAVCLPTQADRLEGACEVLCAAGSSPSLGGGNNETG